MAIVKFNPVRELSSVMSKMNEFFSDFDRAFYNETNAFYPAVDISDDEKNIYLNVEMPGLSKEDVQIKIKEDNVLVIKGEKKQEAKTEDKERNYIRMERHFGEFARYFTLPDNVNTEKIDAKFDKGVLSITIEKKEPEKPNEKLIEIN